MKIQNAEYRIVLTMELNSSETILEDIQEGGIIEKEEDGN